MDYSEWLQKAKDKIKDLPDGKIFELKILFEGVEWNDLKVGARRSFGRFFANECRENRIPGIVAMERGRDNHSRYKRVGK